MKQAEWLRRKFPTMKEANETLYLACLLECGSIPKMIEVIKYECGEPVSWTTREAREAFMEYKHKVLHWMWHHGVVDEPAPGESVYIQGPQTIQWMNGFYDWLSKQNGIGVAYRGEIQRRKENAKTITPTVYIDGGQRK